MLHWSKSFGQYLFVLEKKLKAWNVNMLHFLSSFRRSKNNFWKYKSNYVDFSMIYSLAPFPQILPPFSGLNVIQYVLYLFFENVMWQQSTSLSFKNIEISGKAARLYYEPTCYGPVYRPTNEPKCYGCHTSPHAMGLFMDLFTTYYVNWFTCKNKLKYLKVFRRKHCIFIISLVAVNRHSDCCC